MIALSSSPLGLHCKEAERDSFQPDKVPAGDQRDSWASQNTTHVQESSNLAASTSRIQGPDSRLAPEVRVCVCVFALPCMCVCSWHVWLPSASPRDFWLRWPHRHTHTQRETQGGAHMQIHVLFLLHTLHPRSCGLLKFGCQPM